MYEAVGGDPREATSVYFFRGNRKCELQNFPMFPNPDENHLQH